MKTACFREEKIRAVAVFLLLSLTVFVARPLSVQAQTPVTPVNDLIQGRVGHTATLIGAGKVLIAGGENNNASIAEAEVFDLSSRTFSSAGTMITPRFDHTSTLFPDGRLLLVGGHNGTSSLTSTEWYDLSKNKFSRGPALVRARVGHTATVLADNRILIAGGDAAGSAEIYDPAVGAFILLPHKMGKGRAFASAVLLADGKVLIAGGIGQNDGILNTAELFDPARMSFSHVGIPMSAPRRLPLLRFLPDGKVQVIGGDPGSTMEIYNPDREVFNGLAYLPPSPELLSATLNTRSRAALLTPAIAQNPVLQGILTPDLLAALGRADSSLTEFSPPSNVLVAGGVDAVNAAIKSAFLLPSSSAVVTTDKTDYAPGELVTITGRGFKAGETVTITLHERPDAYEDPFLQAVADQNGNFIDTQFAPQAIDIGRTFTLTAIGQTSGYSAQTVFSDGSSKSIGVAVGPQKGSATYGMAGTLTYVITVTRLPGPSSPGSFDAQMSITGLPPGTTASFFPNPIPFTAKDNSKTTTLTITTGSSTPAGSQTFTVKAIRNLSASDWGTATGTLTVGKATPMATLAVNNSPVTYDGTPKAATVVISISTVGGKVSNVQYDDFPTTPTNAKTYAVKADFVPNDTTNYNSLIGLSAGNFVIQKATPTITWSPTDITYGEALGATQLNATAPVPGLFVYTPTDGTLLNAGNQKLHVDFTPTDTADYNNASLDVTLNIAKANATIVVTPYRVPYDSYSHTATGTATGVKSESLSGLDLSGTTHTDAGTYTDSWTFTDVTGNYNNDSGTVSDYINQTTTVITNNFVSIDGGQANVCIAFDTIDPAYPYTIRPDCCNTTITCKDSQGNFLPRKDIICKGSGIPDKSEVGNAGDVILLSDTPTFCFPCKLLDRFHPDDLASAGLLTCTVTYSQYIQDPTDPEDPQHIDLWMGAAISNEINLNAPIDLEPTLNLGNNGVTPVKILGAAGFDATTILPETVTLKGNLSDSPSQGCVINMTISDYNGDGIFDAKLDFDTPCLRGYLQVTDTAVTVTGKTSQGNVFYGTDQQVRIIK